ncbi:hypothetical protein [Flavobacterium selenitireducens]|uniref:hypothetical protein n=1 Tax=Flavobacterium selenitireducens TaxID=2722704 RepID=UPI00168AE988|nr:hypothetical protein [Flavobacterium selenitireducens]MBD3582744.1 hypothetical protein [Flavobacterium selenitireducens]
MNKQDRIRSIKKELDEIEIQLALLEQMKQSITCRKALLTSELEAVGASAPARKGSKIITPEQRLKVRAELTKGAKPWGNP